MRNNSEFNKNYSLKPKVIAVMWILGILLTVVGSIMAPDSREKKSDRYNENLSIEGVDFKYDNFKYDESKNIYQFDLNIYDSSKYYKTGDLEYNYMNKFGDKLDLKFYEHIETNLNQEKKVVYRLVRTYQFELDEIVGVTPEEMWFIFASINVSAPSFNVDTQTEENSISASAEIGFDYRSAINASLTDVIELNKKLDEKQKKEINLFKNQILAGSSPASIRQESVSQNLDENNSELSSEAMSSSEIEKISLDERNKKIDEEISSLEEQIKQRKENIENYNIVLDTKNEIEDITKLQNLIATEEATISELTSNLEYLKELQLENQNDSEY